MACDIRVAAQSARFGQPEISLGIMPGFGGTQRLPRLVGTNKALEMNLTGEPIGADEAYEFGLVNRVVPDHELLDAALAWARKLAEQAPHAVRAIKQVGADAGLDDGLAGRAARVRRGVRHRRRARGRRGLPREAPGRAGAGPDAAVAVAGVQRLAELVRGAGSVVALTGAGISVPVGDPRLPLAGDRAVGQRGPDGGRPHRRLARRPRALLAVLRPPLRSSRGQAAERRTPRAGGARTPRAPARGGHPEHRPPARQGGHARARRGPRVDRDVVVPGLRRAPSAGRGARAARGRPSAGSRAATAGGR